MSPDRERRLEEIFGAARNLPPRERTAFLERACGGDAALRQQADSLLAAHEQAGQFLQPTVLVPAPNVPFEKSGDRIGRYKRWSKSARVGFAGRMIPSRTMRLVVVSLVLVCTAGCDQVTKHVARAELGQVGSATLGGRFVEFSLSENPGAFLSLGASLPQSARSILTVCVGCGLVFMLGYLVRTRSLRWVPFLGLALIWAGGISNLIDRFVRHGLVTDFMVVRVGPLHTGVFNVADFAIVVGMLMLVATVRAHPRKGQVHRAEKGASG